jgi:hypothetical protein
MLTDAAGFVLAVAVRAALVVAVMAVVVSPSVAVALVIERARRPRGTAAPARR